MRVRWILGLMALLVFCQAGVASAQTGVEAFFGAYKGQGLASDPSDPGKQSSRDLELFIGPLRGGGFEIAWSTTRRKVKEDGTVKTKVSAHKARYRPARKPGMYQDIDNGIAFGPGPVTWARVKENSLFVYRMQIDEEGGAEMHVYERTLTADGMKLLFTATRDNTQVRQVLGSYQKK